MLAKKFVLDRQRANLPTAPACEACNNAKSRLETELTAILPLGGRHDYATEILQTMMPGRLAAHQRARAEIDRALTPRWFPASSSLFAPQEAAIHVDADALLRWISMVALGLVWFHWKRVVFHKVTVEPHLFAPEAERHIAPAFSLKASHRVFRDIGNGAFVYEGLMNDAEEPTCSLWRFSLYGGVELAGEDSTARARTFYVTILPRDRSNLTAK